jgi:hypothetical protein
MAFSLPFDDDAEEIVGREAVPFSLPECCDFRERVFRMLLAKTAAAAQRLFIDDEYKQSCNSVITHQFTRHTTCGFNHE